MNVWKPIALFSIAGLGLTLGMQAANAGVANHDATNVEAGVCHDQPNMTAALATLRSARASLEKAEHDKGGWRAKAKDLTEQAIKETERGCAFADAH